MALTVGTRLGSYDIAAPLGAGIWTVTPGADPKPKVFVDAPVLVEKHSSFSPDGRWIAYMTNAGAGNTSPEVFVQPFPATGAKYRISPEGGRTPLWSPDVKQIIYHQETMNKLMVVDVSTQPSFSFGKPAPLPIDRTVHPIAQRNYDMTPDGKRFLVVLPVGSPDAGVRPTQQVNVVLNWFDELKARAPIK